MGQQMLPPQYGMMIPPGGPGGFHPSIAPMQQYPNQQGGAGRNNNKRGALNANTNRAGRGGRVSSLNPRNQSPNNQSPYGSGITSPIMGNQQLYQPTGYPAPLPPNFYYDPNQAQASQYNPQFEPTSAGAFNNGMPTYYPAPMMYPPTLGPDGNYYPGSPAQQAAMLPPQTRQPQQVPPPPRSVAHSEASQPDSPMPQPAMQGGAPIFQPTTAGYPMSMPMPNGAIPMPFTSPYPQNAAMPFSPPQMPPQHIQLPPQSTSGQVQQGQATSGTTQTLPTYARPSPLYDYSFIVFPPDGTAFWVLGQIEFYFSADNLVRDLFLRQSVRHP